MSSHLLLALLSFLPLALLAAPTPPAPDIPMDNTEPFVVLDLARHPQHWFNEQTNARFTRAPNTVSWISDIEHVIDEVTHDIYLADGAPPLYMCGETVPANKDFELFPYHYYDKEEEEKLGKRINYSLIIKNPGPADVTVAICGMGTTRDWDHFKTWEGALRGDNPTTLTLKPGQIHTLWNAIALEGGLPWSGIVLGRATGDIWVADYCYLGDKDPGIENAKPQPDLAWPPYLLASFTRGIAPWNAASINLFHQQRDPKGRIPLASIPAGYHSLAFAYSPGGPITNFCEYKAVQPTFLMDELVAKDVTNGYSHKFFGGNYTILYRFRLPLLNDSAARKTIRFYLASNDKFKVDSIAGVWIHGRMLWRRVPMIGNNQHWRVVSLDLEPGEAYELAFDVVPLGSRWGGLVGTLEISETEAAR